MWENNVIYRDIHVQKKIRSVLISGMSQIRTEACGVAGGNHLSSRSRFLAGALNRLDIEHH